MLAIADIVTDVGSGATEELIFDIDAIVLSYPYFDTIPPSGASWTVLAFTNHDPITIAYSYTDFKTRFLKYKKGQIEDDDFVGKTDPTDNVDSTANPPLTGVIRLYYLTASGAVNP